MLTAAGRVALEDDKPARWERVAWPVLCVGLGILAIGAVADLVG